MKHLEKIGTQGFSFETGSSEPQEHCVKVNREREVRMSPEFQSFRFFSRNTHFWGKCQETKIDPRRISDKI